MSWASVLVGDLSKGNTNRVVKTSEYVSLPFPCSDSTDCTYYSVTLGAGSYFLEVWGAQGGNDPTYSTSRFGGRGGYSKGTVNLKATTTLYVYVGGSGTGDRSGSSCGSTGGGGGTDIRLTNGLWNSETGFKSRIIVAGGGGGRRGDNTDCSSEFLGNDGGGTTAPTFYCSYTTYGGTQMSGGSSSHDHVVGSFGYASPYRSHNVNSKGGYNGGARGSDTGCNGGAGGGWWGGCSSWPTGSGGSGFVYTSSNSQCSASSDYYLSNASTYSGDTNFPSPSGGNQIGHIGNGFARITALNIVPPPSASLNPCSLYYRYYSNCANRSSTLFIPLMSLFIFILLEDGITFDLHPIFKLR
jgi:hypothetical protein